MFSRAQVYWFEDGQRQCEFVQLRALGQRTDAEGYFNAALELFERVLLLPRNHLARKLVGMGADGAAVMQGARTGTGRLNLRVSMRVWMGFAAAY